MSESSSSQGTARPESPAPEGKLIQIGGRQIRRHQARALKARDDNYQQVALAPEPAMPATVPDPVSIPAPPPLPQTTRRHSVRKRRGALLPQVLAFVLLAALPALFGIAYFGHFASDQYVAEAQFAIRSQSQPSSSGSSGGASSLLGGSLANLGDTQIVAQYIHSDQLLKDIEDDVDIRTLYAVEKADWWARLDPTVTREKLLGYWEWMCTVALDPATGIVTMSVRGFAPEDAKIISEAVLKESEKLVNRLSERARVDAMKVADAEVLQAKQRVDKSFDKLKAFQEKEKQLNPTSLGEASSTRIAKLEQDLTSYETELASLQRTMSATAPSVVYLKNRIEAVERQLDAERAKATSSTNAIAVPALTAQFDKLKLDQEYAEKAYLSVLQSQETARVEAGRQVKYLEAFVRPRLPEASLYPNRSLMILMAIGGGIFLWLMTLLIGATVKEHL